MSERRAEVSIEHLTIDLIKIAKYQKALTPSRVDAIVGDFQKHRMRPIEVSYRDGQYWCFDGQHRLEAYRRLGFKTIPCQIHYGLTYEEEALLFARQQENVGAVRTGHKWNALYEAKDTATLKAIEIALKHGYVIAGGKGASNRKIAAVKTIQDIVCDLGFDGLDKTLWLTRNCWNGSRYSTSVEILSGLKVFLKAYSKHPMYKPDRLQAALSKVKPEIVIQESSKMSGANSGERVAKVIESMYNKKARQTTRLCGKLGA